MMFRHFIAAAVIATVALPAGAQTLCGPRDKLIERLESQYGETQRAVGLKGTKALFEIWASEKGTWTVLMTRPDGTTCPLAEGTDWRDIEAADAALGDPT